MIKFTLIGAVVTVALAVGVVGTMPPNTEAAEACKYIKLGLDMPIAKQNGYEAGSIIDRAVHKCRDELGLAWYFL